LLSLARNRVVTAKTKPMPIEARPPNSLMPEASAANVGSGHQRESGFNLTGQP
jgi:hypothetical protein